MNDKPKYVLCPRCELNYISTSDSERKYCDVCLAELNLVDPGILIPEEDSELEILCPICKVNYMSSDEEKCFLCAKENLDKTVPEEESLDVWSAYSDIEEPIVDDEIEISLSELDEEERENEEDESFDDIDNIDVLDDDYDDDSEELFDDEDDEDDETDDE